MSIYPAKISNIQHAPNQNGNHVCLVTCPGCQNEIVVTLGGWSAIICSGCDSELHRVDDSKPCDVCEEDTDLVDACGYEDSEGRSVYTCPDCFTASRSALVEVTA